MICDLNDYLRKTFKVPKVLGFMDGRVTYVIDKNGIVKHIFRDLLNGPEHIKEAIRVLKEIQNQWIYFVKNFGLLLFDLRYC